MKLTEQKSKTWRDLICVPFLGRTSTSSAKYQDDIFSATAVPHQLLIYLVKRIEKKNELLKLIFMTGFKKDMQMSTALNYSRKAKKRHSILRNSLTYFWSEPGLRRSIDKVYEIVVYSLFSVLVEELDVEIEVRLNPEKSMCLKNLRRLQKKFFA